MLFARGGGGGAGLRLGGAGGADTFLSPANGGGTPNRDVGWLSSIGVFGGRGGGGGPALTLEVALGRLRSAGPSGTANLPASAKGGGALNLRAGGDGSRGGGGGEADSSGASALVFRAGGGGGGPLRLPELLPVS